MSLRKLPGTIMVTLTLLLGLSVVVWAIEGLPTESEQFATEAMLKAPPFKAMPMPKTATTPPCEPDCAFNMTVQGPFGPQPLNLANGCQIKVYYYTKVYDCGGTTYYEIDITDVEITNGCTRPISEILDQAAEEMLEDPSTIGTGNFPNPTPGNCYTSYRTSQGQCWRTDPANPWRYLVCQVDECCRADYTVCRDLAGDITVTQTNSVAPQTNNCSSEGCQSRCE